MLTKLGTSWTILAPSLPALAPSWAVLAPSWAVLVLFGAVLARLGAILGRLGAILGRLGRILASINPPPLQKSLKFFGFFNTSVKCSMFASFAVLEASERVLKASWSHY